MKKGIIKKLGILAAGCCLWSASPALAAELVPVELNSSRYMAMQDAITRIAVGNPAIATVVSVPSSNSEFLVVAHQAGTTSLFVWTVTGERFEYLVGVSPEDVGQAKVIERVINLPDVHVKMVGGKIMLTGTVENQYERNYAVRTAQLFIKDSDKGEGLSVGSNASVQMKTQSSLSQNVSGFVGDNTLEDAGGVIDLLHMTHPSQIRLEAQVIAINPSDSKDLGIVYGSGTGAELFSSPGVFYVGESYGSGDTTFAHNPWKWLTDRRSGLNMGIKALVTQNRAKILSRPSITTMSGESAVIQVGGEIPYTTRDSNGTPNTEFKDYGIILQFKPVVDAEGRIVSSIHTEVSMPSGETVDDQPILDRRRADSVVTVPSGATMVIGGLMDSRDYKTVRKFPFLGDIPVLGEFFKYTSRSRDKQELIILVTPYLVDEPETGRVKMSQDMKDTYQQGRQEKAAMEEVDLNDDQAEDDEAVAENAVEQEESTLGKYLDRKVLPKEDKKTK